MGRKKRLQDLEVVVRYTCEANIKRCVASIKEQPCLPRKIRVIKNIHPSYASMQKAFNECKTRYLMVLDADQTLVSDAIEVLYTKIKKSKNIFQVCGYIRYPWTKELGIGCCVRDLWYYEAHVNKPFSNKLNFDDFLWSLPKKVVKKIICYEMFYADHLQFFNTFRRLMKRVFLRKQKFDGYLSHFCRIYNETNSSMYLLGIASMFYGIIDAIKNNDIDKSSDARTYMNEEFKMIIHALGIKNKGTIIPATKLRQLTKVSWK